MSETTTEVTTPEEEAPQPKLVYELSLDMPGLPKGELLQIPGLGTFENGKKYDVDENEAEAYRTYHTVQVPVVDETGAILGNEVKLGPTLLQASKTMYGVEVSVYAKQSNGGDK